MRQQVAPKWFGTVPELKAWLRARHHTNIQRLRAGSADAGIASGIQVGCNHSLRGRREVLKPGQVQRPAAALVIKPGSTCPLRS
jgi:hypothetical protein